MIFSIIVIFCLEIFVYFNTLSYSFHLDDFPSIVDNFAIRNIYDLQHIWNFWPCRFITYFSFAFNYSLNGLHVLGYHLFNLVVHLGSALLVWWLMLLTLSTPVMKEEKIAQHANVIALFAGLIFVTHPVQTQAVTYIVQRAASMAALFYLASLCLYVKSRLTQTSYCHPVAYYICSLIMAVMAMYTKESSITLPVMILSYEFCFLKGKGSMNWKYVAPFLMTSFIVPLTMVFTNSVNFQEMRRIKELPINISPAHYFLTQCRVMMTYIKLTFFPISQNLDYDYPVFKSIWELPVLASSLFLATVLFLAKRLFSKYRLISFSIFWFFLTLLPESSFLPIRDVIFEHRLYLPLAGYSIFLVSSVYYFFHRSEGSKDALRSTIIVLSIIIACYSFLAYQRNKIWKNEITLWEDVVQKSPHKARPYNNRGFAYFKRGNLTKALSDYNRAIDINPQFADAYISRGIFYDRQGQSVQAKSDLDKAIELNPHSAEAYNIRGIFYLLEGHWPQAIADFTAAIALNPDFALAYKNRAIAYFNEKEYVRSRQDMSKAQALGLEIAFKYQRLYNPSSLKLTK